MLVSELISDLKQIYTEYGDRRVVLTLDDASWPPMPRHGVCNICVIAVKLDWDFSGEKKEYIEISANG
jgi:hypothetical protein